MMQKMQIDANGYHWITEDANEISQANTDMCHQFGRNLQDHHRSFISSSFIPWCGDGASLENMPVHEATLTATLRKGHLNTFTESRL